MKRASDQFSNIKARATPSPNKKQLGQDVTAFLQKLRIHPQAQRILGDSCIPVVRLERLNFQSVLLSSSLQPVVSLVRLQKQTRELHGDSVCLDHLQQNAFRQDEAKIFEIREDQSKFEESSDLSQPDSSPKSWSEPCGPDSPASDKPEQDSGFHCESDPYQPYILFDSTSDEWRNDSGTFYLDPDPEQTMVIELDPELEAEEDQFPTLEDECEVICEMDVVEVEDQAYELCCSQEEEDSPLQQPEPEPESEDFCAVCLNGGDLLCCDSCPKVYHLACHVPALNTFPADDWVCTLCRTDLEPVGSYSCENLHPHGGIKAPYTLSNQDQRRCEKLTLLLYCHTLSAPFHEPVSPLARNYYQIIKRPINLSGIRRKLDKSNTLHYFTAGQFVDDVLLMFKNCATFNYPDSEVAQAGQNLEMFFLSNLTEVFPDQTFTSASQDATDRVRLRWLGRKSKENHKKKRCMLGGKKCYYFY